MPFNLDVKDREYWSGLKVFITGGSGFVGANLIHRLLEYGADVHILLRGTSSTCRIDQCTRRVTIYRGDLADYDQLQSTIELSDPSVIFHLAAARGLAENDRFNYVQTGVVGAANLVEIVRKKKGTRLIVAGSSMEYKESNQPIGEDRCLLPTTLHGVVKASASLLFNQASTAENLFISQLRLFHVYGPWESKHRFLPTAIRMVLENRTIPLAPLWSCRDWIHVDDVVDALLTAALPGSPKGIYNIGSGVEHSNMEIINVLEDVFSRKIDIDLNGVPARSTDSKHRCADISLAKEMLGWNPGVDLKTGITNMVLWANNNPDYWRGDDFTSPHAQ